MTVLMQSIRSRRLGSFHVTSSTCGLKATNGELLVASTVTLRIGLVLKSLSLYSPSKEFPCCDNKVKQMTSDA